MKVTLEQAVKMARMPYARRCPVCNEILFSPADKLSIVLFERCVEHLEDDSEDQTQLLKLTQLL